jgi:hypothetical protein
LSDAEKGDAVIELAETTGETYKEIAETELSVPYQSVRNWVCTANRISPKLSKCIRMSTLADYHVRFLLKYPHEVQDLLATFIVDWNQKNPEKITTVASDSFLQLLHTSYLYPFSVLR